MSKRILFVDDDPAALNALEGLVRSFRSEWNMDFAAGRSLALEALSRDTFDAIVVDVKMRDGSGADLLEQVKGTHPQLLRFALLADFDQAVMLQGVAAAHHSLKQPCEPWMLRDSLRRAFALQEALTNKTVKEVMGRIDRLPSAPSVYGQLVEAMQSPACNIALVSSIVERDVAIAAKLLQLANSPLFGFRFQVSSLSHAVSLLGMNTVKSLALSLGVFSKFSGGSGQEAEALSLWEHSVVTSRMSRRIAEVLGLDRKAIEDSFTAGLLHEIGRLLLLTQLPKEWEEVKNVAETEKLSLSDAEWKVLSCSRDEIGAVLLETWCLPTAIVEAVAWRSRPSLSLIRKPGPLAALHIADCLCSRSVPSSREYPELDREFLMICNLDARENEFSAECEALLSKKAD